MGSISTISKLCTMLLILIDVGGAFRVLFCCLTMMSGDVEVERQMKKRIKHTLIFLAVANSLGGLNAIAGHYWG